MLTNTEFALEQPPEDGITKVKFSPTAPLLVVSSWDKSVRIYDASQNTLKIKYYHQKPVLDCTFTDNGTIASGGLDSEITMFDIEQKNQYTIGQHERPVRCILWDPQKNWIISGGWDGLMKIWDPRSSTALVGTYQQSNKVLAMDFNTNHIVVGSSGRDVWIWDVRSLDEPVQRRESSLKYQTRCIRSFPNGEGYLLSSVEGRVSMEYFDPSPQVQAKKYIFKCHRSKTHDTDYAYPVNCAVFHPNGTFFTGGGDGYYFVWDGVNRKRLAASKKYPTSISSLDISPVVKYLAIASSYAFEKGDIDHPADAIYIRVIN